VVVGVDVDVAGGHDESVDVDDARRVLTRGGEHDVALSDSDVGAPARRTGAVDDLATTEQDVQHGYTPAFAPPPVVPASSLSTSASTGVPTKKAGFVRVKNVTGLVNMKSRKSSSVIHSCSTIS